MRKRARRLDPTFRALLTALPAYLSGQRWFAAKSRRIKAVRIAEAVPLTSGSSAWLLILHVAYTDGRPDYYVLPVAWRAEPSPPDPAIASVATADGRLHCRDGATDPDVQAALLDLIVRRRRIRGRRGTIAGTRSRRFALPHDGAGSGSGMACRPLGFEQSNTSLLYDQTLLLKLYRKPEPGTQPEIEVLSFLTDVARFTHVPPFLGSIEYRRAGGPSMALGLLQRFVPNQGDLWSHVLTLLAGYFDRVDTRGSSISPATGSSPFSVADGGPLPVPAELIGREALDLADLLGRRTADLHRALASDLRHPAFAPTACTTAYLRALGADHLDRATEMFRTLGRALPRIPEPIRSQAAEALATRRACLARVRGLAQGTAGGQRIRAHGDYHLGQVLLTGTDVMIIDFEGEPARSIRSRREKVPPLRDVAGMMRSWHYAAHAGRLARPSDSTSGRPDPRWTNAWYDAMAGRYLAAYRSGLRDSSLLPRERDAEQRLLEAFLLEKLLYEVRYELNHRPTWLPIPLSALVRLFGDSPPSPLSP